MTAYMTIYINRAISKPEQSFFLFGPRGTGKTTWVKRAYPDAYAINLLDESLYQSYLADPSLFAGELRALPDNSWVFVDEIQRLPNLLNEVHRFIEEKKLKFILTGSSAKKIKRTGVNLLAGRAIKKFMHTFIPAELADVYNLDEILKYGSIPLIYNASDKKETLKSYVQMYLKEEINAEALVRNLGGFARFLPVAGLFHSQVINISNIARDAGVSRTTISGYIDILEDTLLARRLPAYQSKLRVRERKHPKLYWCDPGIVRAVNSRFGDIYPEERGILFEGLIAEILFAHMDYFNLFDEIYYWSPATAVQTEVDFILKKDDILTAIEVKSNRKIENRDLKGLKAVSDLPGLKRKIIVYTGDKKMTTPENIEILPFDVFVKELNGLWK